MARKSNAGRPTKLTDAIQKKICQNIRQGNYIETAALMAGISKQTFYDWIKKGHEQRNSGEGGQYAQFLDAVEKAQAEAEAMDLEKINKAAAEGIWQAAAWKLERRFRERWGKNVAVAAEIPNIDEYRRALEGAATDAWSDYDVDDED